LGEANGRLEHLSRGWLNDAIDSEGIQTLAVVGMYEDRALTGAKLALLSLRRHSPNIPVVAFLPNASQEFVEWASRLTDVEIRRSCDFTTGVGWNVKPSVIQGLFEEGHDQVIWLDSDIIVCGDLDTHLSSIDSSTVVATEEYYWGHRQGDPERTTGLGLTVGRTFPATINSGLLRFSKAHRPVVDDWASILASDEYRSVQHLSARERPIHYFADQDTLTGLLGSDTYAEIKVVQLKRGVEIAQCFGPSGFTIRERLRSRANLPLLVHAQGVKPWADRRSGKQLTSVKRILNYMQSVHLELTPYVAAAQAYRELLAEDVNWMSPSTGLGRMLLRASPNQPNLAELPLTAIDSVQRWARQKLGIGRIGARPVSVKAWADGAGEDSMTTAA
jgi:hypothetical protein